MSGFGLNESSPVGAQTKLLEPSPKGVAADEAGKPTEQARTAHGLPTPESTPGPDTARLEADKARQKKEAAKQATIAPGLPTPESTPGPDTARLEADKARQKKEAAKVPDVVVSNSPSGTDTADVVVNKGKDPVKSSQSAIAPETSPENAPDNGQRAYTDEQKLAVERVLKCEPKQYHKILRVPNPCPNARSQKAYKNLAQLLHPDKNKYEGAKRAFQLVNQAAQNLGLQAESEDFAENAYGDSGEESDSNSNTDLMQIDESEAPKPDESEAPKPDDFRKKIYEEATPHLAKLVNDPKDAEAISKLHQLNQNIKEQNQKEKLPKDEVNNFLIMIETFTNNFDLGWKYMKALYADPTDAIAREKVDNINDVLRQLNERHGYPSSWLLDPPKEPTKAAESSGAAASRGQTATKGGVKTKVSVPIPDESDGRTSLGKVQYVRKAGHGYRVIVNRGTEKNPYFEIYPGAEFGKGVAKEWAEDGMYECEDLPKDTKAAQMQVYGRVKVQGTSQGRKNKDGRPRAQIQYYLVRVGEKEGEGGEEYVSTRSALSGMKGLSPARLRGIDAILDGQNEQLLDELDECRERNQHPDTGEQLTKSDIEEMPWLSPDTIRQTEDDDDDDEGDDVDIGNIVPKRAGLKRGVEAKAAGSTPHPPQ